MTEINLQLLPGTRKKIEIYAPGENRYLLIGAVFALVTTVIYVGAYLYHNSIISQIQGVDNQLSSLEQQRDKASEDKLLTLNKKLNVTDQMINSHLFWSDALVRIEKLIQPQVQLKTLSAQVGDKKLILRAEAGGYQVVARQVAAFLSDPVFTNLALNKMQSLSTGRVEFSMQFDFDPSKVLVRKSN